MMLRVLVVDDERAARQTLQGILEDEGHEVYSVANEGEALAAAVNGTFDLAFVDMRLHDAGSKDESGLSLAAAVLALNQRAQVVLVTQHQPRASQVVHAIRRIGAIDFIEKTPDLYTRIQTVLAEAEKTARDASLTPRDATKFSISIMAQNQPIRVRAQGRHVCSNCTHANFDLDVRDYARRSANVWVYPNEFRARARSIGNDLWQQMFAHYDEVIQSYLQARKADPYLVLQIETSRELLSLPVEFLRSRDPADYLVLQHPLARFVCGITPRRQVISEMLKGPDPLRVLIIAANTFPDIPAVERETRALYDFFDRERRRQNRIPIAVKLIPSEEATYDRVQRALTEERYDILHYAGHAAYNVESPEKSCLFLREENADADDGVPMRGIKFKQLLEGSQARLVYLSCCQSAAWGVEEDLLRDDFLGLADCAIQAGVPGVLGFRWPVSDAGSEKLALAFYDSLLRHYRPEVALWHARRELAAWDRDDPTWLSPILIQQE